MTIGDAVTDKASDAGEATFAERGKLGPVALWKPSARVLHDLERDGQPVGLPGRQPGGALSAGTKPAEDAKSRYERRSGRDRHVAERQPYEARASRIRYSTLVFHVMTAIVKQVLSLHSIEYGISNH